MVHLFILIIICVALPLLIGLYSLIDWDKIDNKIKWFENYKK
jgi:hypothetical protein